MAKTTTPAAPEQVVYVGPNIPGVVRQDSVFTGGIPARLAEKITPSSRLRATRSARACATIPSWITARK